VRLPVKVGNEPVTVSLNVVEVAENGIKPVIGKAAEPGETFTVKMMVQCAHT